MICGTWIATGCEREITCDACCCCAGHCQCSKTRVVNRRKERFDVYIGRPGPWGNPFSHMEGTLARFKVVNRAEAIAKFREWFLTQPDLVERARRELRGKVLGCWCKPASCHGDVIAEIIDSQTDQHELSGEPKWEFRSSSGGGQMRRAAKVDVSQQEIVKVLRQCGMSVEPRLARVGEGVPDLLVGWRGKTFLLETKTGERECDRKLTAAETAWHATWGGHVAIVSTPQEAVDAVLRAGEKP